ncbi:hypothetical protein Tco_1433724 [Tanacetum coccineum]
MGVFHPELHGCGIEFIGNEDISVLDVDEKLKFHQSIEIDQEAQRDSGDGSGGFELLDGKSSKEFENNAREAVRVVGMRLFDWVRGNEMVVVIVVAMKLFSRSGEDSFKDISMTLVLTSFLGG